MRVKRRKRCARTDDAEIDGAATGSPRVILGSLHQLAAQARALPRWSNAQQPQIAALAPEFDIDASRKANRVFRNKELPFFQVTTNTLRIDALAFNERLFDDKRRIDQADKLGHIVGLGNTNGETF